MGPGEEGGKGPCRAGEEKLPRREHNGAAAPRPRGDGDGPTSQYTLFWKDHLTLEGEPLGGTESRL